MLNFIAGEGQLRHMISIKNNFEVIKLISEFHEQLVMLFNKLLCNKKLLKSNRRNDSLKDLTYQVVEFTFEQKRKKK